MRGEPDICIPAMSFIWGDRLQFKQLMHTESPLCARHGREAEMAKTRPLPLRGLQHGRVYETFDGDDRYNEEGQSDI